MPVLKDCKRELFCQKWHETGNKSEAYRYAYPASLKWKDESVHNKGSALSKDNEVAARFQELKQETADNHGITIASLLLELEEARTIALRAETPQSSAAVSASMGKAKLVGLDITRIEVSEKEELTPWGAIEAGVDE
jgi:phage terminase small subunit